MLTLSQLGDVRRYFTDKFRNEVYIITEDKPIKCSGILLASRSIIIEEIIQNSENVPAIEFSDNIPGLLVCLSLIYGGSVDISRENYKSIFKFGKMYQIKEMVDAVLNWIAEDLPYNIFWEVYFDLSNADLSVSSAAFLEATKRYTSNNGDDFLQSTIQVCHDNSEENVRRMLELVILTDTNSSDIMLKFFADLLDTASDDDTEPPSSTICSSERLNIITSCAVDYIEKRDVDILDMKGTENLLRKFSRICSDVQNLRKISGKLGDMIKFREPTVSTVNDLSWKLIRMLTSESTFCDTIRYFTEHKGKDLHACVAAEIVLKWWSVREGVCPDDTFIKTLFSEVQDMYSGWVLYVTHDSRYKDLIESLKLGECSENRYFCYKSNHNLVSQLKECIQKGDGTPVIPATPVHCTDNMAQYKELVPAFRYNPAVVPPYITNNGHWYIVYQYKDNVVTKHNFISFITDTQQYIVNCLESCKQAYLFFVPIPEVNTNINSI